MVIMFSSFWMPVRRLSAAPASQLRLANRPPDREMMKYSRRNRDYRFLGIQIFLTVNSRIGTRRTCVAYRLWSWPVMNALLCPPEHVLTSGLSTASKEPSIQIKSLFQLLIENIGGTWSHTLDKSPFETCACKRDCKPSQKFIHRLIAATERWK